MATLDVTRDYSDGEILTEADLDAFLDDLEAFINVTKLNDDNLQNNGITGSLKLLTASVTAAKLATDSVTTAKIENNAITTTKILNEAVTAAKLAPGVLAAVTPTGVISAFGGTSAPTEWLLCDGAAVSRTTYAALFAVIGENFGQGDNSTTFNVPDFRGRFLRGVDGATARDPNAGTRTAMNTGGNTGDNVGSLQVAGTKLPVTPFSADSSGAHTHTYTASTSGTVDTAGAGQAGFLAGVNTSSNGAHTHTISGGDNETRPINAYVTYIIKI